MKHLSTYLFVAACTLLMWGCQKDFDGILEVEIENYIDNNGKVYINNQNYACWHDKDMVLLNGEMYPVNIGYENGEFTNATIEYQNYWNHKQFWAVYPHYYASMEDEKQFTLPNVQYYREAYTPTPTEEEKQIVEAPMVAYLDIDQGENKLKFYNAGALMRVKVYNTETEESITLHSIELIADEGVKLWGTVTYTQDHLAAPIMGQIENYEQTAKHNSIMLRFPNTDVSSTVEIAAGESRELYVAIPSGITTTFQVRVCYTTSSQVNKILTSKKSGPGSIERNTLHTMDLQYAAMIETVDWFGEGTMDSPYQINNVDDLLRLKEMHERSYEYDEIYFDQTCDIEIEPTEAYRGIGTDEHPFKGYYNGNNYTIRFEGRNIVFSGVFGTAHGATIENLNVYSNDIDGFGISVGGIVNTMICDEDNTYNTAITNCSFTGVIIPAWIGGGLVGKCIQIGESGRLDIENCRIQGSIRGNTIGGVVGESDVNILNINNCHSQVELSPVNGFNEGSSYLIGGIIGKLNIKGSATANLIGCANDGAMILDNNAYSGSYGGIIGEVYSTDANTEIFGYTVIADRCINRGKIEVTSSHLNTPSIGGIVGKSNTKDAYITNCINHGNLTMNGMSTCGGLLGELVANPFNILNSYSDGNISGSGANGGLVGTVTAGTCTMNTVYVNGTIPHNGSKWVVGNGTATCTDVYSPSHVETENGVAGITKYIPATWKVCDAQGAATEENLIDRLNGTNISMPDGNQCPWIMFNNKATFQFDIHSLPTSSEGNQYDTPIPYPW